MGRTFAKHFKFLLINYLVASFLLALYLFYFAGIADKIALIAVEQGRDFTILSAMLAIPVWNLLATLVLVLIVEFVVSLFKTCIRRKK